MKMESRSRALDKLYRRRDRYEIPDWQREEVWDTERGQRLIDTILQGWHLPKFYFLKTTPDDDYYEVVDGQQRLTAIWAFCDGDLELNKQSALRFGGRTHDLLPTAVQDTFDDFEIQFEEISDATEEDLRELFQRLQLAVPLTPDEKLNATRGNLRDFCRELAQHSFFTQKVALANRRYAHFGVCVRFAYLEIQGVPNQLRFSELEGLLTEYSGFSSSTPAASRMNHVLAFLDKAFAGRSAALRNRTVVLALLRLTARLVENGVQLDRAPDLGNFLTSFNNSLRKEVEKGSAGGDPDFLAFQQSISGNLTSGNVIRKRERILRKKFLISDPTFSDGLTIDAGGPPSLDQDIRTATDQIEQLVGSINSVHAGTYGNDLFKHTNATHAAFGTLRKTAASVAAYGELVDAFYVIAYEASGDGKRYQGGTPPFIDDVRDLRTSLRHDVDHGPSGQAAKKRRELAAVFRKYSGAATPEVVPIRALPVIQLKLLETFRAMLLDIKSQLR